MKHIRRFLMAALLLVASSAWAYDFEVEGIYYDITNDAGPYEVAVTNRDTYSWGHNSYSGDIVIPETVTYSGIIYSVTSIGGNAFYYCDSLTSIVIPNSVTSIGSDAFHSCRSLTSIEIPNAVTTIGEGAFSWCLNLTSIEMPNSVISIGSQAFLNCINLVSIIIPNSVISIKEETFYGCTSLKTIEIPNSVTSIGYSAFSYCSSLTSIEIPNSVTTIGSRAFDECTSLLSIVIPNSVTTIGEWAFSWCSSLTSIIIPNSVTFIGTYPFAGCSSLEQIIVGSGNTVYDSRNNSNAIIKTNTNELMAGCKNTVIPNSVTSIGEGVFYYCDRLAKIVIPNSVTSIGRAAFDSCIGLNSIIVFGDIPPTLDGNVFSSVNTDLPIYVPCGNEAYASVNWGGFSNFIGMCPGEISVTINPTQGGWVIGAGHYEGGTICTLTAIASNGHVFANWKKDGAVVSYNSTYSFLVTENASFEAYFPLVGECIQFADADVKAICVANWDTNGDGELSYNEAAAVMDLGEVFYQNSSITSFDELQYFIGLHYLGNGVFSDCYSLTSIKIPNTVTTIVGGAFSSCRELSSIVIPSSVDSIGTNPFSGCEKLSSIVVEEGNRYYDSRSNCNAIIETATNTLIVGCRATTIPNTVLSIGNSAFSGCSKLTFMDIPNSVLSIGDYAFSKCSELVSINIPNSVLSIGSQVFRGCSELSSIDIPNSVVTMGSSVFWNCKNLTYLTIGESVKETGVILHNCKNLDQVTYNAIECEYVGALSAPGLAVNSEIKKLVFGEKVKSMPKRFFWATEYVIVRAVVPPKRFGGNKDWDEIPICVPGRSLEAYKNDEFWGQFTNYSASYQFDVRSSDETLGRILILEQPSGCWDDNKMATVVAEPIGDHPFQYWMMNGEVVSTANPYTFVVDEDVELIGYFEGTGVEEEVENMVTVSPNPALDRVRITCEDMKSVTLCTIEGKTAKTIDNLDTDEVEIDLLGLPKGLYLLRIALRNGLVINRKMIIQ